MCPTMSQVLHPPVVVSGEPWKYGVMVLGGVFSGGWVLQAHTGQQEHF